MAVYMTFFFQPNTIRVILNNTLAYKLYNGSELYNGNFRPKKVDPKRNPYNSRGL